ncbi:hypothetical protein ACFW04_014603 [Cataglyphis niger]
MEKVRKEFRESEKKWMEKREELKRRIKGLEGKIERLWNGNIGERKGNRAGKWGESEAIGNRLKEMESRMERREREERRRNVLIKGVEVKEGRRRMAVEELFDSIGVKAEIEEVRKIGGGVEGGREMMVVRLKNENQRRKVWNKKKLLKDRKERILEDWTWKERRMRWSLEGIAREEEKKGRKVWIRYGKIRIDEKWTRNKGRDFWKEVEEWDVVVLSETWLDTKGWDSSRGYLSKGYRWEVQLAERKNKKGKAMGGMLIGISKELKVEEMKVKKRNGLIKVALKVEDRKWNVIGVYVRGDLEKKLEELNKWVERKEKNGSILIGKTLTQEQMRRED